MKSERVNSEADEVKQTESTLNKQELVEKYTQRMNQFKQDLADGRQMLRDHEQTVTTLREKLTRIEGAKFLIEQLIAELLKK